MFASFGSLLLLILLSSSNVFANDLTTDLQALMGFRKGIFYSLPGAFVGWNSSGVNLCVGFESTWNGIGCNHATNRVNWIQIVDYNLYGILSPAIANLDQLWYFNVGLNGLFGTIPPQLGSLTNLQILLLYANSFTGKIPSTLGNLIKLSQLFVPSNELTGTIPSELGRLTALNRIYAQGNKLTGVIPPEVDALCGSQTTWFVHDVECNFLVGQSKCFNNLNESCTSCITNTVPSINPLGQCVDVNECADNNGGCGSNQCVNSIGSYNCTCPAGTSGWLPNCVAVTTCSSNNGQCGATPNTTCVEVQDSPVQCSCSEGYLGEPPNCYLPQDCSDYNDAYYLNKFRNGFTFSSEGTFDNWESVLPTTNLPCSGPNRWYGVNCSSYSCNGGRVTSLTLTERHLEGTIGVGLPGLGKLASLDLSKNTITSTIPSTLGNLVLLTKLHLSENAFVGLIPSQVTAVCSKAAADVDFRCNALTGLSNSTCLTKNPSACPGTDCPTDTFPVPSNIPAGQCSIQV